MTESTLMASHEYQQIAQAARKRSREAERDVTSLDLLYAIYETKVSDTWKILNKGGITLSGRNGIKTVEKRLRMKPGMRMVEPPDTMSVIAGLGAETAKKYKVRVLNSRFILMAMLRVRKSLAMKVLIEAGADVELMRRTILADLSELAPSVSDGAPQQDEDRGAQSPEPTGTIPVEISPTMPPKSKTSLVNPWEEDAGTDSEFVSDSPFALDPEEYPLLTNLTRNVTMEAAAGKIDPVIGRQKEIAQTIQILRKRRANNPVLVGEPGVGKTALVEGLALEIVNQTTQAKWLKDKSILGLEISQLLAGTQLRGSFSGKMLALRKEVRKARERVIIFIDEIHTIVGAGGGDTALDAANELKTALARGEFPCIGATTKDEYKTYIEKDEALERRFQPVIVGEPSPKEAVHICKGIIEFYEEHHEVTYDERAIESAVRLSSRYMMDRRLPDKAIDLLDTAGAYVSVNDRTEVKDDDIARVVSDKVQIPVERMLLDSSKRFKEMEEAITSGVVGHRDVVSRVCETVKRGFAGFSTQRPIASFLFAGSPGVGKQQLARSLAGFLFNSPDEVQVFDMSEFAERHSVSKLVGAAPGYVGYEQGGRLTELMYRKPFQLLFFRDLKAAHPDVQELIARLIRTGFIEDGKSRRVFFTNTVIVVSQDIEDEKYFSAGRKVGFASPDEADTLADDDLLAELKKEFTEGLYGALDARVVFRPLSNTEMRDVVRMEAARSSAALEEERNISFALTDRAVDLVIELGGFTQKKGGRYVKQTLVHYIEAYLADQILDGTIVPGDNITLDADDGRITRLSN